MIIDPNCKNKSYATVDLDRIIFDEINKLAFDPTLIKEIESDKPEKENNNAAIETRIKEIDKQVERLLDLYQLGTSSVDDVLTRMDKLNSEKQALTDELEVTESEDTPSLSQDEAEKLLVEASEILESDDLIKKRELVHSLIDSIEIDGEDIIINWAFV